MLADNSLSPTFEAIELNLGGRGIRSIDRALDGSGYLILAGPSGSASAAVTHDFRLFTWSGDPAIAPIELDNNLDALLVAVGGSFESIAAPRASNRVPRSYCYRTMATRFGRDKQRHPRTLIRRSSNSRATGSRWVGLP